ncbi:IMP dehydrogenase [Gammaproteobacteria bacterium]|nr:IMP dehydrogenase [Gammaproteobacteria bacterium]MDA9011043.1 IMP dehydrogenase [Gammaproteobacteria bacterium]MDA9045453.1 IMP dehydrogenase [Gammaproteobacteria bacterium]MDB4591734.1 IMP dehydrogenase [Gammaproteobacteria bacterium]MDC1051575.1 IMP dehydrogenase [Gammaproteobacteria bacterium]
MDKVKLKALTFDDVLLLPRFSDFIPSEASTETKLTNKISLKIPLISAAMDTVTESRMAIALAEAGGIGIIHKNNEIAEQANQVRAVKKYESGVVRDPITIESSKSISELQQLTTELKISGMPVVDNGQLKGIVTSRDFRYADNMQDPVSSIMTPFDKLVTVKEGTSQDSVKKMMYENRIEKILVIDEKDTLSGLVTMKDIEKSAEHPDATKDSSGRLMVGAALGTGSDTLDRARALHEVGVDVFVIDSAHGHSKNVLDTIKLVREHFPDVEIVGGNVATPEGALALVEAGADAIKVGMGPGSICTTRIIAGIGVPQITAIMTIRKALVGKGVSLIADGGIRFSGDIAKAIAAGADSVMMGGLFAGTEEAPGEVELFQGRSFKTYRGMGSIGAMTDRKDASNRYLQDDIDPEKLVPEGIEGRVPYKGLVISVINQLIGGVRQSMGYVGCKTIDSMKKDSQFIEITNAGMTESHVHDVMITKEAPNYQRG